jgi:hypothetical protein
MYRCFELLHAINSALIALNGRTSLEKSENYANFCKKTPIP